MKKEKYIKTVVFEMCLFSKLELEIHCSSKLNGVTDLDSGQWLATRLLITAFYTAKL